MLSSRCLLKPPQEPDCYATLQCFEHSALTTLSYRPPNHAEDKTYLRTLLSCKLNIMIIVEYKFCNDSCQSTLYSWLCFIPQCSSWSIYPWSGKIRSFPTSAHQCSVSFGGRLATRQQELGGQRCRSAECSLDSSSSSAPGTNSAPPPAPRH